MGSFSEMGRWLVVVGVAITVVGGIVWLLGKLTGSEGNLPGTIRIEGPGYTCIFPVLASIVLSLILTFVLNLIARWMNK